MIRGALNCVIEARIEAAVCRASEINEFDWGVINAKIKKINDVCTWK